MHQRHNAFQFVIIIMLSVLGLVGGTAAQSLYQNYQQATAVTPTTPVQYQFIWETGDATPTPNGWQFTTDLGYQIELETGRLANATIELIPCENDLITAVAPTTAHAGHGNDQADPSRVIVTHIESLTQTKTTRFTATDTPTATTSYCQAYYLVAPQLDLPADDPMAQKSLTLTGRYTPPNTTTAIPFTLQTHLPWGTFGDIDIQTRSNTTGRITVQRHLDTLFNGVNFQTQTPDEQATNTLRNLLEQTTFIWN